MTLLLKIISLAGLALTVIPSVLVFTERIMFDTHTSLMLAGMLLWFGTSPFWMKEKEL
ncbi:MAG: hypothetical protein WEA56_13805 [Balneolaceae bacterium]